MSETATIVGILMLVYVATLSFVELVEWACKRRRKQLKERGY